MPVFFKEHRDIVARRPDYSVDQLLVWVDVFIEKHGEPPTQRSGEVEGTSENWCAIDLALRNGCRGLPGGSSLSRLLTETHRINQDFSEDQILVWADAYYEKHGDYPMHRSGKVEGTPDYWFTINKALRQGLRGLPGGSSLSKLLRSKRPEWYSRSKPASTKISSQSNKKPTRSINSSSDIVL